MKKKPETEAEDPKQSLWGVVNTQNMAGSSVE